MQLSFLTAIQNPLFIIDSFMTLHRFPYSTCSGNLFT